MVFVGISHFQTPILQAHICKQLNGNPPLLDANAGHQEHQIELQPGCGPRMTLPLFANMATLQGDSGWLKVA